MQKMDLAEDDHERRGGRLVVQEPHIVRKLAVEFFGTALFVFIGSLAGGGLVGVALAHGVAIAVLIIAMGHISGGHFNPAVTVGVAITRNIKIVSAALYVVAQLLGGFAGALLVRVVTNDHQYEILKGGATIVPGGNSWLQAIICEIVLTYTLVSTVLLSAVDTDSNVLAPLAIGLSIVIDILAGGAISGASMNPARSFGPCISATIFADSKKLSASQIWSEHFVYWVGPLLGAALAGLIYKLLLARDGTRILLKRRQLS